MECTPSIESELWEDIETNLSARRKRIRSGATMLQPRSRFEVFPLRPPSHIGNKQSEPSRVIRDVARASVNDATDNEGDNNDEEEPNGRKRVAELHTT